MEAPAVFEALDFIEAESGGLGEEVGNCGGVDEGEADGGEAGVDAGESGALGVSGGAGTGSIDGLDHEVGALGIREAEGEVFTLSPPGEALRAEGAFDVELAALGFVEDLGFGVVEAARGDESIEDLVDLSVGSASEDEAREDRLGLVGLAHDSEGEARAGGVFEEETHVIDGERLGRVLDAHSRGEVEEDGFEHGAGGGFVQELAGGGLLPEDGMGVEAAELAVEDEIFAGEETGERGWRGGFGRRRRTKEGQCGGCQKEANDRRKELTSFHILGQVFHGDDLWFEIKEV